MENIKVLTLHIMLCYAMLCYANPMLNAILYANTVILFVLFTLIAEDKNGSFPGYSKNASQSQHITEEEWHLAVDRDGRDYYWNAKTAQVCWKKPSPKQAE